MPRTVSADVLARVATLYDEPSREFFARVWQNGVGRYAERLRAIGYEGFGHVLDCGFGMGQWLVALSDLNTRVSGIDRDPRRVEGTRALVGALGLSNVEVREASAERLPYDDGTFDAVFCYGVIFLMDVRSALAELRRVLAPGGRLYFTANGLGWFLFLLFEQHNKSATYDPREVAASALETTILHRAGTPLAPGGQLVVPSSLVRQYLEEEGFSDVRVGPEGGLSVGPHPPPGSFYGRTEYLGREMVYEVLARR